MASDWEVRSHHLGNDMYRSECSMANRRKASKLPLGCIADAGAMILSTSAPHAGSALETSTSLQHWPSSFWADVNDCCPGAPWPFHIRFCGGQAMNAGACAPAAASGDCGSAAAACMASSYALSNQARSAESLSSVGLVPSPSSDGGASASDPACSHKCSVSCTGKAGKADTLVRAQVLVCCGVQWVLHAQSCAAVWHRRWRCW